VVEIHRALRKHTAAVHARDGSQLIEEIGPVTPPLALVFDPRRNRWCARRQPNAVASPCAKSMAVRTDDVALCRLGEELLAVLQRGSGGAEPELLFARISMVEVHLVRRKSPAAIRAGHLAKLAQERRRGSLASSHSLDLALAVRRVVGDVVGPLVAFAAHGPF
jgi:hypothetical protein